MELSVALFILLLGAATIVGIVLGVLIQRWRASHDDSIEREAAQKTAMMRAEVDEAIRTARREVQQRQKLAVELETAAAELAAAIRRSDDAEDALRVAQDQLAGAERDASMLRANFRDVVGLESENTTLRAIAARVPELEARLEAVAEQPQVIDLREGSPRR